MLTFKVKGLNSLQRDISKLEKQIEVDANAELQKIANSILADAVSRVHVRSGKLKASAFIEPTTNGWKIGFGAKYAPYEEFGTGPLTEVPKGYEDYAMEFFVNGKGFQPAHPYLFPAFLARRDKIVDEIEKKINELLKSK